MSHPEQFCYLRPIWNLKFLSQKTVKGVTSNHSVTPPPPTPPPPLIYRWVRNFEKSRVSCKKFSCKNFNCFSLSVAVMLFFLAILSFKMFIFCLISLILQGGLSLGGWQGSNLLCTMVTREFREHAGIFVYCEYDFFQKVIYNQILNLS